jgi:hypothetical protein
MSTVERYQPLELSSKQIRLLRLLPFDEKRGREPRPWFELRSIQCELFNTSLDASPVYEALSYTWGCSGSDVRIEVNGQGISVRANLAYALAALRSSEVRVLWVDALCINQNDTEERNHQVGQMGEIYSQSQKVLVWLGRLSDGPTVASAVELADRIGAFPPKSKLPPAPKFGPDDESAQDEWIVTLVRQGWRDAQRKCEERRKEKQRLEEQRRKIEQQLKREQNLEEKEILRDQLPVVKQNLEDLQKLQEPAEWYEEGEWQKLKDQRRIIKQQQEEWYEQKEWQELEAQRQRIVRQLVELRELREREGPQELEKLRETEKWQKLEEQRQKAEQKQEEWELKWNLERKQQKSGWGKPEEMQELKARLGDMVRKWEELKRKESTEWETQVFGRSHNHVILSLNSICHLPYWSRLWIVQEVLLASKVIIFFGDDARTTRDWDMWTRVRHSLEQIPDFWEFTPIIGRPISFIKQSLPFQLDKQRENRDSGWPLHALISATEKSLCEDPRDKIYGLLGLASDFRNEDLDIDYSKPLHETYQDVIRWYYNCDRGQEESFPNLLLFSQLVQMSLKGHLTQATNDQPNLPLLDNIPLDRPLEMIHTTAVLKGSILPIEKVLTTRS